MIFTALALPGAFLIEVEPQADERGSFARIWCAREFGARGLSDRIAECAVSFNRRRGTLRGMHYQAAPHAQAKVVHCARGAIYDVIIDLRSGSSTYLRWLAVPLLARSGQRLYVSEGFAHGFQTLEDDTEVVYQMSDCYCPEAERGIRWDDPTFAIAWPDARPTISSKDRGYSDFRP
jgi:dTDP-4-dehydrorhamnose 3,5-epimerase